MKIEIIYTSEYAQRAYEGGAITNAGPQYATEHSAAFDVRAIIDEPITIMPGEQYNISTGLKLNMRSVESMIPPGMKLAALIMPRSGRGSKEGLCIANTVGLIDEDYLGVCSFTAWARPTKAEGSAPVVINPGERIGQLMFVFVPRFDFKVVEQFSTTTARGEGGFGSTGRN